MRWIFRAGLIAATALLFGSLAACVGPARAPVSSFSELTGNETVVVGRVEISPPLTESEQRIKVLNAGMFKNKVFLIADERHRVLTEEPGVADYGGRIEATLGKTFFVGSSRKPFYILGGMMYLNLSGAGDMDRAYLPGGMKVDIRPGDKAVYIGTIQYHRNEFFEITKVVIVDDYARANAEFRKEFGSRHALRKALLTRTK